MTVPEISGQNVPELPFLSQKFNGKTVKHIFFLQNNPTGLRKILDFNSHICIDNIFKAISAFLPSAPERVDMGIFSERLKI